MKPRRTAPWRADGAARRLALGLLLALAVLFAYLPAMQGGFIWDDDDYLTENRALEGAAGLRRIWTEPGATPQYYPLVFTSFWVERRLWGLDPRGYHVVNVLLHLTASLLLWALLARLGLPGAFLGACLFALHPVHVESVAWITERKNVLSGACYLGAALAWFRFSPPEGGPRAGPGAYLLALALFVAALLSKSVTASLPAALLLVAWWRRGRLEWREAALLAPYFLLGAALGLQTAALERTHVGAAGGHWDYGLAERTLIAGRAVVFYLGKLLWPHPLVFIYPRWRIDAAAPLQYLYPAAVLALAALLWAARRRLGRGPLAALLFFVGTLFPALGFVNVYPMRFSFVADHFQYLASIGPLALAAAVAARAAGTRLPAGAARGAAAAVLLLLGALTWRQGHLYRDLETLWRGTLARNPAAEIAAINLGAVLEQRGDLAGARALFEQARRLGSEDAQVFYNLGVIAAREGNLGDAKPHFERALRLRPDYGAAHYNLGVALLMEGRLAEARRHLEEAVRLVPGDALAHWKLGETVLRQEDPTAAERHLLAALRLRPDLAGAARLLSSLRGGGPAGTPVRGE